MIVRCRYADWTASAAHRYTTVIHPVRDFILISFTRRDSGEEVCGLDFAAV
jgi:hypothetical protein